MTDLKNSPYLDKPLRSLEQAQADTARSSEPIPDYEAAARKAGWVLGPNGKWWNPAHDDGSRYCNTDRAFRYICEDHGITID